jgi:thioredoxin reductase (NADPH)
MRDEEGVNGTTGDGSAVDVAIVGAGPCGLATAIFCQRAGLTTLTIDRGALVSGVAGYPTWMTFFSTAERIAIADIPFPIATEKPTRRDALAYYRLVAAHERVPLRLYEEVLDVQRVSADDAALAASAGARPSRFRLRTRTVPHGEPRTAMAHAVVVATGYFGRPSLLGVPGEELPHVSHFFHEGHAAFERDVVVVGGGNSAVDAALELWRCGARVTMVHFLPALDPNVKPWVRPDIEARIREGSIGVHFGARVARIEPHRVVVQDVDGGPETAIAADHVYAMTGFLPNTRLLEQLGVPLGGADGIPAHDPATMETSVPGVFIAGVIASGNHANRIFIENGRDHGRLIAARLTA